MKKLLLTVAAVSLGGSAYAQSLTPTWDLIALEASNETYQSKLQRAYGIIDENLGALQAARVKIFTNSRLDKVKDKRVTNYLENEGSEENLKVRSRSYISELDNIHYQINPLNDTVRIRLRNTDGSYFGDWHYGSNLNELLTEVTATTFDKGYLEGFKDGLDEGWQQGYSEGFVDGFALGYDLGKSSD